MKTLIFCAAFPNEISALCRRMRLPVPNQSISTTSFQSIGNCNVLILTSGMGVKRMYALLNQLDIQHVDYWISIGVAGSLVSDQVSGQCVIGHKFQTTNGTFHNFPIPSQIETITDARSLLCVEQLVTNSQKKNEHHEKTGAILVDMESIAVANHAKQRGESSFWIKAVSDGLNETMPLEMADCMNSNGFPSIRKSIALLLKKPYRLPTMIRLGKTTHSLNHKLAETAMNIIHAMQ